MIEYLYDNIFAKEINLVYCDLIEKMSPAEATKKIEKDYNFSCLPNDEYFFFWTALADTQWDNGQILQIVKSTALAVLRDELKRPKYLSVNEAERLRYKLKSEPQKVERRPKDSYSCKWKDGDVYALKMISDAAREINVYGKYILLQKVSITSFFPNSLIPVVYAKITRDSIIPTNREMYNELPYVQIFAYKTREDILPSELSYLRSNLANQYTTLQATDEYGCLKVFRFSVAIASKEIENKNLKYIGNFCDCAVPDNEFIPNIALSIISLPLNNDQTEFEYRFLELYRAHTLKESKIYHGDG